MYQLASRRASRLKPRRPKQVRGLTRTILDKIIASCPTTLQGMRDAALISVGYDTLCRSSELALMEVEPCEVRGATAPQRSSFPVPNPTSREMDASPIFPLILPAFFLAGLMPQGFEAVHSSEPFTLIAHTMAFLRHPRSGGSSNAPRDGLAWTTPLQESFPAIRCGLAQRRT